MALEKELETFDRELPGLLINPANVGRYVLIGGSPVTVAGVYKTEEDALAAGYEMFGLAAAFLAKRISPHEEPKYFSRNIRCPR
ncbi:hypothetical protein J8F10_06630 [Gemmata sp. G18]|uniref:Uncharacterized protein n=1 Tax=Gemmata palustris TaxID=2822762 RepID=A0ABS5BMN5_9BACT|nr:hypothetical protein [Gemmata palustris]MBP3954956.1 hypothetical protein [Gemmata palustris]